MFTVGIGMVAALILTSPVFARTSHILGPSGSGSFGTLVVVLPNGNFVVTDPGFDSAQQIDIGAVYLYDQNAVLISTLIGSSQNDHVGSGGVFVLSNGNYVVCSPQWDNQGTADAGAATFLIGGAGVTGTVSPSNSLVGTSTSDQICAYGVVALTNGNYVVKSETWHSGATPGVGAATWGNGATGVSGPVSSSNSLVGSTAYDFVGDKVIALSNGNYVVNSQYWHNGSNFSAGAVTWGSGATGVSGVVSTSNSLVGNYRSAIDAITNVTPLINGNYVVTDGYWYNGSGPAPHGAACWANGLTGLSGLMSSTNCLVGIDSDYVGILGATALSNGNYVVNSWLWQAKGAATWGDGTTGLVGYVSISNSLVGSAGDRVGSGGIVALSNGNYVVVSPDWHNQSAVAVGATTWASGQTGLVTSNNSLVGSSNGDSSSQQVVPLTNGNYVVARPYWDNPGIAASGSSHVGKRQYAGLWRGLCSKFTYWGNDGRPDWLQWSDSTQQRQLCQLKVLIGMPASQPM